MNSLSTSEIEGSQLGAALAAGNSATLTNLKELRNKIGLIREIASQYCSLTVSDKKTRVYFVCYFVKMMEGVNAILPEYVKGVMQGQYVEPFCIATGRYREEEFWTWCNKICIDMADQKLYGRLKDNINRLKELLEEAENAIMHCKPELFEEFFFNEKKNYSYDGVKKRFDDWMYENMCPDIERLRELQALVVAETLKKGVLDFAPEPSNKKIGEVKVDYLRGLLPCYFEMTQYFIKACAKWKEFMRWKGTILVVNYKKYGKYIQRHYYDFNNEQLQAIFELDMMLNMIHKEMQRLMSAEPTMGKEKEDKEALQKIPLMGEELEQQLKPLFYNNEDDVKLFLKEIDGMPPNDITDLVNQWVKNKRISDYGNSRKGALWGILNKAGLYNRSRQNWNGRVD